MPAAAAAAATERLTQVIVFRYTAQPVASEV
jgi:hypothetical protein